MTEARARIKDLENCPSEYLCCPPTIAAHAATAGNELIIFPELTFIGEVECKHCGNIISGIRIVPYRHASPKTHSLALAKRRKRVKNGETGEIRPVQPHSPSNWEKGTAQLWLYRRGPIPPEGKTATAFDLIDIDEGSICAAS